MFTLLESFKGASALETLDYVRLTIRGIVPEQVRGSFQSS